MGKRALHVAMDDLLVAMEGRSESIVHYFNQRTGEVGVVIDLDFDDGEEPGVDPEDPDQVEIPAIESHDAFRTMERFVDGVEELDVQRQLRRALEGRGAFRRFRDTLAGFPDLRERWEAVQRDDLLRHALAFLDDLGIEPIYELRSRPAELPLPTPPKEPHILLHHLLLLGAPDGKTELIEGRVHRSIRERSPQRARKLFERLAREIMELQGLAWRRSAVEGLSAIELGPFRLHVEDDVVWLSTEVPREIWRAFT